MVSDIGYIWFGYVNYKLGRKLAELPDSVCRDHQDEVQLAAGY